MLIKSLLIMVALFAGLGLYQVLKSTAKPKPDKTDEDEAKDKQNKAQQVAKQAAKKSKLKDKLTKRLSEVQGEKIQSRLRSVSLHQVTFPPKSFTGRKGELLEAMTRNREGVKTLLIYGDGGIGKTTFCTLMTEKLRPFHTHSQIYFDMNWAESSDRAVYEAMAHVVQTYRPDSRRPMGDRELAAGYRAVLRNQKSILLIENVSRVDQIQKLIPPSSCTLIVTSNKEMKMNKMYSKELATPPSEDSRDLLLKLCPRVGFWTAEISKSCGHNPLAVSICGKFLATVEESDPGAFSTQLRDQQKKLERGDKDRHQVGLEAALTLVLSFLPDKSTVTLAKMMAFPASFDSQAEGFVCEDRDGTHLQTLADLGIIHYEHDNSRYRIHTMVRQFMDRKELKPYLNQAQIRHSTYYMTTLEHIHQLHSSKDKNQKIQALNTFDLEWTNIREGQAWARATCMKDGDAARVCNSYADSGSEILRLRRPPRDRLLWFEGALTASRYRQDGEAEKNHLLNIGKEYLALRDYPKTVENLETVIKICEEKNDPPILLEACHNLGLAYVAQGQFEKGFEYFHKELEGGSQIGNPKIEIRSAEELGKTHIKMNQYDESLDYLEKALEAARKSNDLPAEARILLSLGEARIKTGQPKAALEHLRQGLSMAAKTNNPRLEASYMGMLGDVHVSLNEYPQASSYYDKAASQYRSLKDSVNEADTLGRQGIAWIKSDNLTGGIQTIEKAINICKSIKNIVGEMTLLSYLGAALLEIGNIQLATDAFDRQLSLAKKTKSGIVEAKALHNLGQLEEKQGNLEKALTHLKTALSLYEKAKSPQAVFLKKEIETLKTKLTKPVSG